MYDYPEGKLDWLAAGFPTEGTNAGEPRAGAVVRSDVPTCGPDDDVVAAGERIASEGWDRCLVVNAERVLLGELRLEDLRGATGPAEKLMRPGPGTFRPYLLAREMAAHMVEHGRASVPITTSDGRLVGLLRLEDALRAVA